MTPLRLAELVGRLSLAFDIANDAPYGKAVRSVVLATELGRLAGATDEELHDTYWLSLLAYLGCTGFAHEEGLMGVGDDRAVRKTMSLFSPEDLLGSTVGLFKGLAPEASVGQRVRAVAGMFANGMHFPAFQKAMCETSIKLAQIVGAGPRILAALEQLCERWDGRGLPKHLAGEALALPIRLHQMGHIVEIAFQQRGREGAVALVQRRAGRHFDPRLCQVFVSQQAALFAAMEDPAIFERFLSLEPRPFACADEQRMDAVARALAIFADLKCPVFLGHSTGVAQLSERAAAVMGLGPEDTQLLRWAALLHDLGRVGVPNGIWCRPGRLDWGEMERVRLHSHYTERVLSPAGALQPVAEVASAAHERLDGSGYPRYRGSRALPPAARILAAADVAFAMGETRPHRDALPAAIVARELTADVGTGRLDRTAADAVLAALGMQTRTVRQNPHGVSERELEVCRLVARGRTNKQIAIALGISLRTVQNHLAHIFPKLEVHSRSGIALWLVENDFVH